MKKAILLSIAIVVLPTATVQAEKQSGHAASGNHAMPYAGQDRREIKTLSEKDIDDLRNGRGWGLAKAAELNGLPGPAHLLQLKKEISLSPRQVSDIEAMYAAMKARAIPLGKRLVALEHRLNKAFAENAFSSLSKLRAQLSEIAEARRDLRFVHLSTHLETPSVLTRAQIDQYNRLRGYGTKKGEGAHRHN